MYDIFLSVSLGFCIGILSIIAKSLITIPISIYIYRRYNTHIFENDETYADIIMDENNRLDVCIKGPVKEEIIHRGAIGGWILPMVLRCSKLDAHIQETLRIFISSLIFGVIHLINSSEWRCHSDELIFVPSLSKVSLGVKLQIFLNFVMGIAHEIILKKYGWVTNIIVHCTINSVSLLALNIIKTVAERKRKEQILIRTSQMILKESFFIEEHNEKMLNL